MPARRATAKRKAPTAALASPLSSKTKKNKVKNDASGSGTPTPAPAASSLATKFITRLAEQLSNDEDQGAGVVGGALSAALDALPKGKLKTELARDQAVTVKQLAAEVRALRAKKKGTSSTASVDVGASADAAPVQRKRSATSGKSGASLKAGICVDATRDGGGADGGGGVVAGLQSGLVPCTAQLRARLRAKAENSSSQTKKTRLLRLLAMNPRAPLDLLVDAMQQTNASAVIDQAAADAGCPGDAVDALKSAVDRMRILAKALAADPRGALSRSGLALYAHRAEVLASAAAAALTVGELDGAHGGDSRKVYAEDAATDALGLMLRVLQVAGLASSVSGQTTATPATDVEAPPAMDPADCLLLPCFPETSSRTAAATEDGGGQTSVLLPPDWRRSVARLLAHYATAMAACAARGKGGAAAVDGAEKGASRRIIDGDESSSDEDSDEDTSGRSGSEGGVNSALSRHLLALCAGHISGNEFSTLEFVRCLGDARFASRDASARPLRPVLTPAMAASLVPTCARVLARLPRPTSSPAPTAAQFLRRAYASRVVEAFGQVSAFAATGATVRGGAAKGSGSGGTAVRPWDFVGAAAAPRSLLDFLGRSEAPVAVGGGAAGGALSELASRRHSPAAVGELLRSSAACAPAALGPLLTAIERLGCDRVERKGEDGEAQGQDGGATVGVFFVDTAGAGAGGGAGAVLAPLGDGGGVVAMDQEGENELGVMSGEDESSVAEKKFSEMGFVVDTRGKV